MRLREWPEGHPRILVTDAWLANAGDGAIALATQRRLERLVPHAAVIHAAYQCDLLAAHYPELALVPPLSGLLGVTREIPELLDWDPAASEAIVRGADLVLCQGGGYAMEHYNPWQRLRAWELVVESGLPIAFGAQSVGPFRGDRERSALSKVFGAAVVICLRESDSVRNVLELGAKAEQVRVTADETFDLFSPDDAPTRQPRGIACVVSRDPQLGGDGRLAAPDISVSTLSRLVAELVRLSDGEGVTIFSTFQGLGNLQRGLEDDSEVAAETVAALPGEVAAEVQMTAGYLSPRHCADLIASHRAVVTTRMHPAIIGVARGVPAVLVTRAFKATSMFAMLGLGDVILDSPDPDAVAARLSPGSARCAPADAGTARDRAGWNDAVVERLLAAVC